MDFQVSYTFEYVFTIEANNYTEAENLVDDLSKKQVRGLDKDPNTSFEIEEI